MLATQPPFFLQETSCSASQSSPPPKQKFVEKYEELLKHPPENKPNFIRGWGAMATKITYGGIRRGERKPLRPLLHGRE
ncbi:hypothetical protein K737_300946 [Holospora undulata HU1]|uniref:Uncharacterized protein n=1 Tax=Holospora undulata HU1 TaxID=1321371 RepID=A0A061JH97_9PROT|nr:hypothetical protein [Holospora undulata]ETZ04652.1 hypothetical protein K737_300946 [Holospora undulata HU1]